MYFYIFPICAVALIVIGCVKIYIKLTTKWARSPTCLLGKTVIVTGSNTGIGFYTALDFAKRGARVILACRDYKKGEAAREEIIKRTDNPNVFLKIVDLSSFESVRAFAQEINKTEDRLDVLVNNAAAALVNDKKTKDGHLLAMQVNYFSLFLLTNLLLDLLKKSQPSRIVNTSSLLARIWTSFSLDKLHKYNGNIEVYAHSKVAIILFTKELAKRLEGSGVTVYSLHPGAVKTDIFRNAEGWAGSFITALFKRLMNFFFKTSEEGAQTTIYCAVEKNIEKFSGHHFEECRRVNDYKRATVPGLGEKLWRESEEVVNLTH
ncbi:retinol dehydrogenase 12-like isoform X2 [Tenebrio molitor]|uniref:retinol dehydrogenase 12-like isoform X2 n=1 Tax=Tenebrio molitor TaxID=7067 RepID=UPI0036248083